MLVGIQIYILLTLRQLLNRDHLRYTVSFIETKIIALDEAAKSNEGTAGSPSATSNQPAIHVYLGSKKKETTVAEFADGSAGNGLTYPVFRRMLENFLNKFYQAQQLPHERYLKIQGDQKVNLSKILLSGTAH